ncbi:MAG: NAD(P)H-hydrate dehydratase [Acidobacteria bacterium]|nr:NAD(P)H-hydrate dehydratase [Acidobacteriota bacterium]
MKVCTVDEMRAMDRTAIKTYGIPGEMLMENAGEAVYFVILSEIGVTGKQFLVLAGAGHNGGDGLVTARKLNSSGGRVHVMLLSDPATYDAAPRLHLGMVEKAGIPLAVTPSIEDVRTAIARCDVVVDAMLGTGISREVGGLYRDVIEAVNASGKLVVGIDIPSGVDGNTGKIWGTAIRADLTVTFGTPKRGNLLYPGAARGGRLFVCRISFPPELSGRNDIAVAINDPAALPPRRPDGHKGSFGDALFVAGAAGYFGAPAFSALAMLKAGGGYARLATPRSVAPHLAAVAPEVVYVPQPETPDGSLSLAGLDGLLELAGRVDFVVLGPGLSLADEAQQLARRLAQAAGRPLLIDGDGLSALASETDILSARAAPTILTPHVGEMARLTGHSIAAIVADPIPILQETAAALDAFIVLKGAHSLIGTPDGRVFINVSGNSALATAGSGDVLTGTIAAMFGLGLEIEAAVTTGVFLHGLAGDLAAEAMGADGVTARTVLETLPRAVATYRRDYDALTADACGAVRIV